MKLLHHSYGALVRTLQRFQHQPPPGISVPQSLLDNAQLVTDRLEMLRRLPRGGRVMECGVDEGKFSRQILDICQPNELILVDTWGSSRFSTEKLLEIEASFAGEIQSGRVRIIRNLSTEALAASPDHSLDWVYIDTNHNYPTTKSELELAKQKVIRGGYICGHDYTVGTWESYTRFGVVEAVNEFCVNHTWQFAMLSNEPRRHLSFALQGGSSPLVRDQNT
ncbi:MAG: class I SAM-dependent methyltransferase [Planctomycetaceae bacterium]|nr:class I SAM-dependent methyltransferase [Planctomycetaceae bacterium]